MKSDDTTHFMKLVISTYLYNTSQIFGIRDFEDPFVDKALKYMMHYINYN